MASGDDLIGLLLKAAVEGGDKEKVGPKRDRAMSHESRTHAARAVMGALKKGDLDAFDQALHAYFTCCKMEHGDTEDTEYVGHR